MDKKLMREFDKLVPKDQLLVAAMITVLSDKDRQIRDLVAHVHRQLDGEGALE